MFNFKTKVPSSVDVRAVFFLSVLCMQMTVCWFQAW